MNTRRHTSVDFGLDTKMTPMIDVIFQLLIFFLCTAGFTSPEAMLPTKVPESEAAADRPARRQEDMDIVRIELGGDESSLSLRMNGEDIPDAATLFGRLTRIARVSATTPVVLDVAATVPIGRAIEILDGSLVTGLTNVHFAARRAKRDA